MTLLYTDPIFLDHDTGAHPETAGRVRTINEMLDTTGLRARCTPGRFSPLDPAAVIWVHSPEMVDRVRQAAEAGGGRLDPDTVVSPASYHVGLAAAGVCVAAVDAVLDGADRTALAVVRPPGHHATPTQSMGFCLFNSIALAVHHARHGRGVNRVLIVDWDVHHGNGTQDIFYADPSVFFYSIHRYGNGFYPGTGAAEETGTGAGTGTTLNAPIRFGTSRADYHAHFAGSLARAADACKPELVLVSAGFDAHRLDPIGNLGLEEEDYATLTQQVIEVARTHAGGRLVSCLEGGYHWQATANSLKTHLDTILAAPT
jgi:acetoin utilization deacetylase AcuC-like enzyme